MFQTGGALIDPSWVIIDGPTFNELELYVLLLYKMWIFKAFINKSIYLYLYHIFRENSSKNFRRDLEKKHVNWDSATYHTLSEIA